MSKFKAQNLKAKIENALHGIMLALKAEKNLRIHVFIAVSVIIAGLLLNIEAIKLCILLLTIGLVIIGEMTNSAIEFALDAMYKNKYSQLVKMAKDICAGTVLFTSVLSVIIGLIIFIPAIAKYI